MKEITLLIRDFYAMRTSLQVLQAIPSMNILASYKVAKICKPILAEINIIDELTTALVKKHMPEGAEEILKDTPEFEAYQIEYLELMDSEVTISIPHLLDVTAPEFQDVQFKSNLMNPILPILED